MPRLSRRSWVPTDAEDYVQTIADTALTSDADQLRASILALAHASEETHDVECINLNPATNTMSEQARAAMQALNPRPSLGYPGDKYEMGLEAIEQIEVIAAELAAQIFDADFAEVRIPSGALANLFAFLACTDSGDAIVAPPASIGGHVTHHRTGAAGLRGLTIHDAPIDPEKYTVDVDATRRLAADVSPAMITIGSSLNLTRHDVAGLRSVADEVGAVLLFDAAHLSGPIAGGAWPNPLAEGAHVMTMSTYKSLAGPAGGLLVTNDAEIASAVDAIAFPGLTANFDAAKTAGLAVTLAEWRKHGAEHADMMVTTAAALAQELDNLGAPVVSAGGAHTASHAFALDARSYGGGHACATHLRRANILASAIGLPSGDGDGLRIGTNELVRWGATVDDMERLAQLVFAALESDSPETLASDATAFRARFTAVHFAG